MMRPACRGQAVGLPRSVPGLRLGIAAILLAVGSALLPATATAQEPAIAAPDAALEPGDTLDLERALRIGLSRSPAIESADAAAAAAHAARWADWGAFIPSAQLNVNLSQTSFTTVTFLSPEGAPQVQDPPLTSERKQSFLGLSFDWNVFRGGQNIAGVKAGAARSRAAVYRLSDAQRSVVRDVKVGYFEALKAQRLAAVARDQLQARREDLEVTRERYRIAGVTRADLLGAEAEVAQAELTLLDRQDQSRAAVRELEVRMGYDPGQIDPAILLAEVAFVPQAARLNADSLLAAAIATDPELLALGEDESAASAEVWAARATYIPTISLGLDLNRSQDLSADESLFNLSPDNTATSFSVFASWPLFSGFTRKEQNAQASSDLRRARADYAQRSHETEKQIRDLVDEIDRRRRRLQLLEQRFDLDTQRVELTRQQYRLGAVTYDNLLIAIREQTESEQALLQERYDYLQAWAELERLVGGDR